MTEVLEFTFQSFWVFIGVVILFSILCKTCLGLVAILFTRSNVNID